MTRPIWLATAALLLAACSGEATDPAPQPQSSTASNQASDTTATDDGGPQNHTGGADARPVDRNGEAGAFGASCTSDSDCASGVCFVGGHGGFCSLQCTSDSDCPPGADASAPHCNPHGDCRY